MNQPANREVAIFNAALELPASERATYLDEACVGDPDLRERVEGLLQAFDQAEDFLVAPPTGADFYRSASMAVPLTEKPGDKIGRYKLLQQIGEGGCGVVYMAEQEEPVKRRVALKIIKLGMDTKQVIGRFEAERQALALMDHPNIAKVLDAGATDTGRPYFVMELVRGIKITQFCDENNMFTEERLKLFIQVCQAIQHAHQKGIIHRDIKPSNILVTVNDGAPVPKVIDFGIAKATAGRLTDKTLFTAFEQFIGTPAYMSPEQAVMTSLDIDTRSDIYSLGVLLYELLTGKTPFDQKELLQSGLDAMRRTILEQEPLKPSTRLTQELVAAPRPNTTGSSGENGGALPGRRYGQTQELIHLVRGDLDWIVMKSLEKDRARRYETANGLAADIQRHLNNEPVSACPPGGIYRMQKAIRRNKGAFAAAAAISIVLIVGVIVTTSQAIRATRAEREQTRLRQQAESEVKKTKTEAAKSEQIARFLKSALGGASPYSTVTMGSDRTALLKVVDRTAARIGKDLIGQPEVEAELRYVLSKTYSGLDDWVKAEAMIRETLRLRRSMFGETNKPVAEALDQLAFILCHGGKPLEAEAVGRQVLALNRKLFGAESAEVAGSLDELADSLTGQPAKLIEAEGFERESLALHRKLQGNEHLDTAWALFLMSHILDAQGKSAEAESDAREAVALYGKLHGDENAFAVMAKNALAEVLKHEGKLAEAEKLYREVLAFRKKTLGTQNPGAADILQGLGDLLAMEGKLAEAESSYREALAIRRTLFGNDNPGTSGMLHCLGDLLAKEMKLNEAESCYREALVMRRTALGNEHPHTAGTIHNLADVLRMEGKLGEAESLYREALLIRKKLLGDEDPATVGSYRNLIDTLRAEGKQAEAKSLLDAQLGAPPQ